MRRQQITEQDLKDRVAHLNTVVGKDGTEPGSYLTTYAYGGVQLQVRVGATSVNSVTSGYEPKRVVYEYIGTLLAGMSVARTGGGA